MSDTIKSYSSKATAVRGLERAGMTKDRAKEFLSEVDGKWQFDQAAVDAALGLKDVSEEDENLILACGHSNCPECGIHLSNGLMDFDSVVDRAGGEAAAYKEQKHEWSCMGCGAEWGKAIEVKASKSRNAPTRHYTNKSTVDGAVALCHDLFNSIPDARRKDAIQAAVDKGVAFYTARTQYQKWFKAQKANKVK